MSVGPLGAHNKPMVAAKRRKDAGRGDTLTILELSRLRVMDAAIVGRERPFLFARSPFRWLIGHGRLAPLNKSSVLGDAGIDARKDTMLGRRIVYELKRSL